MLKTDQVKRLTEALKEAADALEYYADADCVDGRMIGNRAMRTLNYIAATIKEVAADVREG